MGQIAPGILYRSNHPIRNNKQVKEVVLAVNAAKIKTVINLCDSMSSLQIKVFCCPLYRSLLEKNRVITLNMSMNFSPLDNTFLRQIKDALIYMSEREGPYLIHCEAGMDRTGFFAIMLESLMSVSMDEIARDYMLSYVEEHEYSEDDEKNGYRFLANLFTTIKGKALNQDDDPQILFTKYLKEKVRISDDVLALLIRKLRGLSGEDEGSKP